MPDNDLIPRDDPASGHYRSGPGCKVCGEDMGPHADYCGATGVCELCQEEQKAMNKIELQARVIAIEDADQFVDKTRRVRIRITNADGISSDIRMKYTGDEYGLGDEFTLQVGKNRPAPELTISKALAALEARFPDRSLNITMDNWSNFHDHYPKGDPNRQRHSIEFQICIFRSNPNLLDSFRGQTLQAAFDRAMASVNEDKTSPEESDYLVIEAESPA